MMQMGCVAGADPRGCFSQRAAQGNQGKRRSRCQGSSTERATDGISRLADRISRSLDQHVLIVVLCMHWLLCCACTDCCAVQLKIQYQQLNLWLKIRLPSLQWTRIQCWMCRIRQCTLLESIDPSHHRRWHHWRQWITAGHLLQCQIDGLDSCRN